MKYNNLKNNAQNIHMPEDMKERIIKNCENAIKTDNTEFTDNIFKVEKYNNRNFIRIISGLAACAVIAGSIGLSAKLMKKHSSPVETSSSKLEQKVIPSTTPPVTEIINTENVHDYDFIRTFLASDYYINTYDDISLGKRDNISEVITNSEINEISAEQVQVDNAEPYLTLYSSKDDIYNYKMTFRKNNILELEMNKNYELNSLTFNEHLYYQCDTEQLSAKIMEIINSEQNYPPFGDISKKEFFSKIDYNAENHDSPASLKVQEFIEAQPDDESSTDAAVTENFYDFEIQHGDPFTQEQRDQLADLFNNYGTFEEKNMQHPEQTETITLYFADAYEFRWAVLANDDTLIVSRFVYDWNRNTNPVCSWNNDIVQNFYKIDYSYFKQKLIDIVGFNNLYILTDNLGKFAFPTEDIEQCNYYKTSGSDEIKAFSDIKAVTSLSDDILLYSWYEPQEIPDVSGEKYSAIYHKSSPDAAPDITIQFYESGALYYCKNGVEKWYLINGNARNDETTIDEKLSEQDPAPFNMFKAYSSSPLNIDTTEDNKKVHYEVTNEDYIMYRFGEDLNLFYHNYAVIDPPVYVSEKEPICTFSRDFDGYSEELRVFDTGVMEYIKTADKVDKFYYMTSYFDYFKNNNIDSEPDFTGEFLRRFSHF